MKTKIIFFAILFSQLLYPQTEIHSDDPEGVISFYDGYTYYDGYDDYLADNPIKPEIATAIKEQTPKYIIIDNCIFNGTGEKSKAAKWAWGLKYNNELYFNMMNASYIYTYQKFAKFDIIGKKYMVILLDVKKHRKVIGYNNPYGGGLMGALMNMQPKNSWRDKNGKSFKILFIDVENPIRGKRAQMKYAYAYLLDTQKIIELYNKEETIIQKLKKDDYLVEDFLEFVNKANQ